MPVDVEPAAAGLKIPDPTRSDHQFTVAESCGGIGGRWYCVTHSEAFGNQLQKDFHIGHGHHVLAWVCPIHGPEVP